MAMPTICHTTHDPLHAIGHYQPAHPRPIVQGVQAVAPPLRTVRVRKFLQNKNHTTLDLVVVCGHTRGHAGVAG